MTVSRKIIETHHGQISFLSPEGASLELFESHFRTGGQGQKIANVEADY